MLRIVVFLLLVGLAAAGSAWVAEQTGDVVLNWGPWRIAMTLPVFVLALGLTIAACVLLWNLISALLRAPSRIRKAHRARRHQRGRHAITHGLLAIGHGDSTAARQHADTAKRLAGDDPLTLLLHAQAAQLEGDRDGARRAFRAMAERPDTRLLGLRGLFIEAQRADDAMAAVVIADEALKLAPNASWASHAVLGFRCAQADWNGALAILDGNYTAGMIDKPTYRRQRGVLLTARAMALETENRDLARASAMEAVKLAPTLVPAAVLAAKFESEAHQVRRAMKIIEAAWAACPHPDLADAYAHVRLGDSAVQRLTRIENLAARTRDHVEGALAVARAAIDAAEFGRARTALAPFTDDPTQRVAMLMAELERTEHGDAGKAREWTLRAVRARHDPAWTADGYVSDQWRPISPVTGRLDAFQWQTPVASLPSERNSVIESSEFAEAVLAPPSRPAIPEGLVEPPRGAAAAPVVIVPTTLQDNEPPRPAEAAEPEPSTEDAVEETADKPVDKPVDIPVEKAEDSPVEAVTAQAPQVPAPVSAEPAPPLQAAAPSESEAEAEPAEEAETPAEPVKPVETAAVAPTPLFRNRSDLAKPPETPIQAIVPIMRPPDDPGVDDEDQPRDEFAEQIAPKAQAGGWRGFWSRFGS
ncbi:MULTISPECIES: heme biosynthesis HemY N-terminal domain-containing protein [unclassified Bradyrhizobium]|uniref:heme biosynthesis HemY N-terminal domain-containing protein n=1 Tax=unclassified Bradyrhizobium TaxID=2631580 RepID=UPI0028E4CBE2|nr:MULTISPECIES: heme biosynthesis HemY N-terminal domain-containing protein [unclassified Bradyrhizobium]